MSKNDNTTAQNNSGWITMNGTPVKVDDKGNAIAGPPSIIEKTSSNKTQNYHSITGNELGSYSSLKELRGKAIRYYQEELQGKPVTRKDIGEIRFSGKGLKETRSFSANEDKLLMLPALRHIIETGTLGKEEAPNHKRKDGIVSFIPVTQTISFKGSTKEVEVLLGKDRTGHLYYDLFLDNQRQKKSPDSGTGQNQRLTGDTTSIDVVLFNVNILDSAVNTAVFSFDFQSSRHKDENGFLHVSSSHISKETVNPYYGFEIPNYKQLGLDQDRIYYGYRKGTELAKGAKTFNGLPLLLGHYAESAEDPQIEHRVGSLGTDAIFISPYLNNSLIITEAKAIESIEKGTAKQISCAYRYDPIFTRGTFEGQHYDFIMTNIRGNHVALVEEGRAGADVAVADSALQKKSPSSQEHNIMKESPCDEKDKGKTSPDTAMDDRKSNINPQKKGNTIMGNMGILAKRLLKKSGLAKDEAPSEEVLQATEQLIEAVGEEVAEQALTDPQQVIAESIKKVVEDDSLDDEAKTQAIIDLTVSTPAITGESQQETTETQVNASAKDEETALSDATVDKLIRDAGLDPTDKSIRSGFLAGLLANKTAQDEEPKSTEKEEDNSGEKDVTAQDAALIRKQAVLETTNHFKALLQAGRDVMGLCGDVNIFSFDSAIEIYSHALKSCGRNVSTKDISALRDMVAMAKDAKNQAIQRKPKEAIPQNGAFSHLAHITVSR